MLSALQRMAPRGLLILAGAGPGLRNARDIRITGGPRQGRPGWAGCSGARDSRLPGGGPVSRVVTARHARAGMRRRACGIRNGCWQRAIVHVSLDTLGVKWIRVLVRVDGEVWQGVATYGMQHSAGVLRHHLDMAIEQDPVAGPGFVAVACGVPATLCRRVLADRDDSKR